MNEKLLKSKYYIKKYLKWLTYDLKFFWFRFIGLSLPFILIYIFFPNERSLLRLGAFLQFVGIAIIFYDINKTRRKYSQISFLERIKLWLKEKPEKYGSTYQIEPEGMESFASFNGGRLTQPFRWNDKENIEDNIKYLFECSEINRENIELLEVKLNDKLSKDSNEIKNSLKETVGSINDLEESINNNVMGGLKVTFVSSFWVLIGMLLSTLTNDIVSILNKIINIDNNTLLNVGFLSLVIATAISSIYAFSNWNYVKNIFNKLDNGEINLKDEDIGKVLLQHIGEIGIAVLLLDKLQTTSIKYQLPLSIEIINYLWIVFKILIFLVLLAVNFYSYGRLAVFFGNKNISQWKFFLVLIVSIFVFGWILIT